MKMRKFVAGVCALSMLGTVSAVSVNAEVVADDAKTTEIADVTEIISGAEFSDVDSEETDENEDAETEETEDEDAEKPELSEDEDAEKPEFSEDENAEKPEKPELPEDFIDIAEDFIDIAEDIFDIIEDDEDFKNFIMNDETWKKLGKKFGVVTVNEVGHDKNGHKIFSHDSDAVMNGYDENDEPVLENEECPEEHKFLGFDDNGEKLFSNNKHDKFIWFDENDTPVDISADCVDEDDDLYKTVDVNTGHDILVKHHKDNDDYVALDNGDANADSSVDIRDITILKKAIVKLAELPDYMVTADVDHDNTVDVKDLGMLIKFIIGICDINA